MHACHAIDGRVAMEDSSELLPSCPQVWLKRGVFAWYLVLNFYVPAGTFNGAWKKSNQEDQQGEYGYVHKVRYL